MTDATATRRVQRGNYHSYLLDGLPVPGVTTILKKGIPNEALATWGVNETAAYAVDNWTDLDLLKPSERLAKLKGARWEKTRAGAIRGTAVHQLALALAAGEEVTVPEPLAGHVESYLQFVQDWQPEELLVEAPVFHRDHRWAGTLDLITTLADGQNWLLDWKTAGKGIYPETAIQLSAYRRAQFWLDHGGLERSLPAVDRCAAVWLRADGYDLIPLRTDDKCYAIFRYAQQIHNFVNDSHDSPDMFVHDALTLDHPTRSPD